MGQLIDGVWHDTWYDTKSSGGKFQRSASAFRNWLTADGAPGPSGEGGFAAEKDRYHLYVSLACPWAHRTLIFRKLKGLEPFIPVSVVNPLMLENGWTFDDTFPAATYDEAVEKVFTALARLEQILGQHRYLTGDQLTEADIRLWTTLVRFDPVYVTHFKCDKYRISDYLNLYGFLRDIYQIPGIAETVNLDHIRHHYFRSHKTINPTGIISIGPWQDLLEPHGRDVRFG
ncbi:glutathione S-transferase C-terminal domain-containing protein [Salmonella enterica]|nr:glutathione S-transferase C-terminal domain-containing protein [Salmonella enterica]